MIPNGHMGEACFEGFVSDLFLTDRLESLDVSRDLTFADIEVDAGPVAKLFDYVK